MQKCLNCDSWVAKTEHHCPACLKPHRR
jgi:RNA polymerase subunit RPABC4/transcription elongation factor Spt4